MYGIYIRLTVKVSVKPQSDKTLMHSSWSKVETSPALATYHSK